MSSYSEDFDESEDYQKFFGKKQFKIQMFVKKEKAVMLKYAQLPLSATALALVLGSVVSFFTGEHKLLVLMPVVTLFLTAFISCFYLFKLRPSKYKKFQRELWVNEWDTLKKCSVRYYSMSRNARYSSLENDLYSWYEIFLTEKEIETFDVLSVTFQGNIEELKETVAFLDN